jgi:hypothetical protein
MLLESPIRCGGSLVRSLGQGSNDSNIKSGSHRSVTFRFTYLPLFFLNGVHFLQQTLNPELSKGWVFSGCLRMHRGCWKTYTSHVKRKDVFRSSSLNTPNGLHRFSLAVSSKGRQFTGSARRVGVRHLGSVYMHTPPQFCRSITPHSTNRRHISWSFKSQPRPTGFNELPDNEEDVARIAILNKVMKGRQPTDLILRCE